MGVDGFSKIFKPHAEWTLKNLKGKRVAIDAMTLLYRASLGMKKISGLTNKKGEPTLYINVAMSKMINFHKAGATQIWCFDHDPRKATTDGKFHNPMKSRELAERKKKKETAKAEIEKLQKEMSELTELTSPGDDEDSGSEIDLGEVDGESIEKVASKSLEIKKIQESIDKQEKSSFSMRSVFIDNIKKMLDLCDITWIEAPAGCEGEALAARLTHDDIGLADIVFSGDTDVVMFGAKNFLRDVPRKKTWSYYNLEKLLDEHELKLNHLHKIAMVLGCDFYKEKNKPVKKRLFYRIGPKKVISYVKDSSNDSKFLNEEVKKALDYYDTRCSLDKESIKIKESFKESSKIEILLTWLEIEQNFTRARVKKQFEKIIKL